MWLLTLEISSGRNSFSISNSEHNGDHLISLYLLTLLVGLLSISIPACELTGGKQLKIQAYLVWVFARTVQDRHQDWAGLASSGPCLNANVCKHGTERQLSL